MILIYRAAQLRLAGYPEKHCAMSCDLASKVVDGLNLRKELRPLARKLTVALTGHYESLQGAEPTITDAEETGDNAPPQSGDYLFNRSPGSAMLHDTSVEIFEKLCNSYSDEDTLTAQDRRPPFCREAQA